MLEIRSHYPFPLPLAPFDQGQFSSANITKQPSDGTNTKQTEGERRCPECPADKVSKVKKWYIHPNDRSTKICTTCYQRIMRHKKAEEMAAREGKCPRCPANEVRKVQKWCTDPIDRTTQICHLCYRKALRDKRTGEMAAKGVITCPECPGGKVRKIKSWHFHPNSRTIQICGMCYRRVLRDKGAGEIIDKGLGDQEKEDSDDGQFMRENITKTITEEHAGPNPQSASVHQEQPVCRGNPSPSSWVNHSINFNRNLPQVTWYPFFLPSVGVFNNTFLPLNMGPLGFDLLKIERQDLDLSYRESQDFLSNTGPQVNTGPQASIEPLASIEPQASIEPHASIEPLDPALSDPENRGFDLPEDLDFDPPCREPQYLGSPDPEDLDFDLSCRGPQNFLSNREPRGFDPPNRKQRRKPSQNTDTSTAIPEVDQFFS